MIDEAILITSQNLHKPINEIKIKYNKENKKLVRLDLKWLYKILKVVEIDKKAYKYVKLYINKLLIKEENCIKNAFPTGYGQERTEEAEIHFTQNSEDVNLVLDMCKDGCYYKELLRYFQNGDSDISSEVIERFIEQLVKIEYILRSYEVDKYFIIN